MACPHRLPSLQLLHKGVQCIKCRVNLFPFGQLRHHKAKGINHGRNSLSLNLYHDQEGTPGTCGKLLRLHRVCRACTPPLSHPPSAEPHTMSLSWHRSHIYYQMSFPCVSASPSRRYLCLHQGCRPIYLGTHGDWQRYEGAYWLRHTAQGRHQHQNARVCTLLPHLGRLACPISQKPTASSPYSPVAPKMTPTACSLVGSGITIRVQHSRLVRKGVTSPTDNGNLRLRWSSTLIHRPRKSGGPGIHRLPYRGRSPSLLGCTPH